MITTAQNETGEIRELVLKRPREAFVDQQKIAAQWRQLGYGAAPDMGSAIAEYDQFVAIIRDMVPQIELRFAPTDSDSTIDSIYVRDAAIVSDRGAVLAKMGKRERGGEPAELGRVLTASEEPILGRISGEGRLEGGDVVWLDRETLAVGHGYRTNGSGIDQLRTLTGCRVIEVGLPHYRGPADVFHLMSIMSPVDVDLAVVYSPLVPVPFRRTLLERGIRLVEVPDSELDTLGCNVLAVAPRRCVMVEGNPRTVARLEGAGAEVRTFAGEEICLKGGGGPTCLTRPLRRAT